MNPQSLIIGACAGVSIWALSNFVFYAVTHVELVKKDNLPKHIPVLFRFLLPLLPLSKPFVNLPLGVNLQHTVAPRLWMAGFGEVFTPQEFVGLKVLFFLLGLLLLFVGALTGHFIIGLIVAVMLMIYPMVWLNAVIQRRQLSIMKALPNVLDLLTLSVESGKDLLSSLRDILARRKLDDLGEELLRTFQEIQLGRKRTEALRALSDRVRQVDLSATVNAIIQAEELGVSVGQLLRIQGDMQRNKRFTLAEKLANEASVKIILPVVLFILPAVFIILIVPLVLHAAKVFR